MEKLTIQEEEVMLHIWSMGECFVKDIVAKFPEPKAALYYGGIHSEQPEKKRVCYGQTIRQHLSIHPSG